MGFFDRKQKQDTDDPNEEGYFAANVEEVRLDTPLTPTDGAVDPQRAVAQPKSASSYGIAQAIKLMRAIPVTEENLNQVVLVVKTTLESTNVSVRAIIDDATKKLRNLEGEIQLLKDDIANFEAEIAKRRQQIADLTADHEETTLVKDRLSLAESLAAGDARKSAKAEGKNPKADEKKQKSPDQSQK